MSRAHTASFALLSAAFTLYVLVLAGSVLGLRPLASRVVALLLLLVAAAVAAWVMSGAPLAGASHLRSRARGRASTASPRALSKLALAVALAGALVTFASWLLAVLLPVGAYDALGYRLPAVVQWLDAGQVTWVVGDDPLRNGYPLALEVIEAVTFRALGSPRLVDGCAHLFLLAGACAVAGYGRGKGLSRPLAALAAGLFLLVPIHVLNAPSGYADAAFAGVLVAFFLALARWLESAQPSRRLLVELGITAAFAVALKPHGFAFVLACGGLALLARLRMAGLANLHARAGRRASTTAREAGLVLVLAAPGWFFAVRNVVKTGNPIYPLELRVFGRVLLRGKSSLDAILTPTYNVPPELAPLPSWLRPLWVWLQPHGPAQTFDDRLAGFGYAFLLLGLPALGYLGWRAYRERREQPGLATVFAASWLCWLLQPFSFWSRFTSWLWGAAALAIALSIQALLESGRGRSALLLTACCLLFALPEALYALQHVKRIDRLGLGLLRDDAFTALTRISTVDADFARALASKRDVCRTPWRLGTDDANLDGVLAQLAPRPNLHVINNARWPQMLASTRAHGCDQLIVIGDNPLPARVPASLRARISRATAFGDVQLLPALSEVIP